MLDIGGGRGELSFELLNLNTIKATIVDPRPASLHKQAKWLQVTGLQACLHARLITSHLHSRMCMTTRHAASQQAALQWPGVLVQPKRMQKCNTDMPIYPLLDNASHCM